VLVSDFVLRISDLSILPQKRLITLVLSFEKVSYRYDGMEDWALRGVDLTVAEGEYVLVAGASGSGKSTFCRLATGLAPHFHGGDLNGRVLVDGLDTREVPVSRLFGHVGLVFQNIDAQLFNRTVEDELGFGLEVLGLEPGEIEKRRQWVSDVLKLGPLLERSPHQLSGGEKQRVVLGAILALRPRLLLLDEPFAHLDPEGSAGLRSLLKTLRGEGPAVVVVEHRLQEVVADVDRLVIFHQGRLTADGPPRQVLKQELTGYGLNLPPLVGLFRAWGLDGPPPLTPLEAIQLLASEPPRQFFPTETNNPREGAPLSSRNPEAVPVVEIQDLWFGYPNQEILKGVKFHLRPGECAAILGRNGAGKTTLIKHLNGLLKPSRGTVLVLGRDTRVAKTHELARGVGFAWQNPNDQLFQTSVREEVLIGPRTLKAYDPSWCERLFKRFGLGPLLERSPFRLSEGEKKRVAFATALAARPEIVILDEPTAGQDEPFRRELGWLIRELREEGKTVLLVTHDLEFAAEQAPRWLVLSGGRIIADGSPETIMVDRQAMAAAGLRPTQRFELVQLLRTVEKPKGEFLRNHLEKGL
jgi:energy-coupling factor transport system ATP-binding protein